MLKVVLRVEIRVGAKFVLRGTLLHSRFSGAELLYSVTPHSMAPLIVTQSGGFG